MQSRLNQFRALVLPLLLLIATGAGSEPKPPIKDLVIELSPSGFLSSWLRLGPFPAPGAYRRNPAGLHRWNPVDPAQMDAPPRKGTFARAAPWREIFSGSGKTDLGRSKRAVTYLSVVLQSQRTQNLWLSTGSDDGLAVWLNGALVRRVERPRRAAVDIELTHLPLRAGENVLVLKLTKIRLGPWRLYARLMDEDFSGVEDVSVRIKGGGDPSSKSLLRSGKLVLTRKVDLDAGSVAVEAKLRFPGGRPVGGEGKCQIDFEGPGSPSPIGKDIDWIADRTGAIPIWSGVFRGEKGPIRMRVDVDGVRYTKRLGFTMRDLNDLAGACKNVEKSSVYTAIPKSTVESVKWRIIHLKRLIEAGDEDYRYIRRELRKTLAIARVLAGGTDYYHNRKGVVERRGYRSDLDGSYQPYTLYVPPRWTEGTEARFGLLVVLHGHNGSPMKSMQDVFGLPLRAGEEGKRRERYPLPVGPSKFFVLAPGGFGNAGYRGLGEVDVLDAMAEVQKRYPIDSNRIFITGTSMGGTGAVSIPFHYPDRFAAAVSLAGYHSLWVRQRFQKAALRPWERFMAAFRSNENWAENGQDLPLYLVHGLRDMPKFSGALHDRYRELGYRVSYETPDLEHNVWDETYRNRRIFGYLDPFTRTLSSRELQFITYRLRYRGRDWIQIDGAVNYAEPSKVQASWDESNRIAVNTSNVSAITLFNEMEKKADYPIRVALDGAPFDAEWDWPFWQFHRFGSRWRKGPEPKSGHLRKRPGLAGPMDDAYYEPLLFVYGTADEGEGALSKRIIEKLRRIKTGVTVEWPVKADVNVTANDLANHSLVIVGTPTGNRLLRRMADQLPIRVHPNRIEMGSAVHRGEDLSAGFIYPNPLNPDRYVLVHTGTSTRSLYTAGHLPKLLPDYIVYDASKWDRAGGLLAGNREVLSAGFFDRHWAF